jgi:hypothetical protein
MKFSLSTFAALAAIMPVIASEPLKIPMVLTVVTNWQDGSVTLPGQPPFDIGIDGKGDEVSIVVGESLQKYQRIGEILFDNIDPNDKRRVQFSRLIDGQGVTRSVSIRHISQWSRPADQASTMWQ